MIVTENRAGELRYLLPDGLGSVRQALDEDGRPVFYYEFDPYGNPVNNTGGGDPYGYTGEWWDSATELLHLRARWYDPAVGRFLSRDPLLGDILQAQTQNPYVYGVNNPSQTIWIPADVLSEVHWTWSGSTEMTSNLSPDVIQLNRFSWQE